MPDIWGLASIAAKFSLYLGILGATGTVIIGLVFYEQITPVRREMMTFAKGLAFMALLAAVAGFLLRAAALTGDISGMYDADILGLLWQTSVGEVLLARVIGMVLVLIGLYLPRMGIWVSVIGGLIALWSFTQIGHIPEKEHIWLRLLLLLHLAGIAFWIGVLAPLNWLCKDAAQHVKAAKLGHMFGTAATLVVPALLVAGFVMAWMLLGDIQTALNTRYAQVLLVKIALIGALLGAALLNKQRYIPSLRQGDDCAALHLSRAIHFEWVVILGILAATAVLTSVISLP